MEPVFSYTIRTIVPSSKKYKTYRYQTTLTRNEESAKSNATRAMLAENFQLCKQPRIIKQDVESKEQVGWFLTKDELQEREARARYWIVSTVILAFSLFLSILAGI